MLSLPSPAKINLFLEVTRRRGDGFHDIESVFTETALADTLHAEAAESGVMTLECAHPAVPADGTNLILRAAALLRSECGVRDGIHFRLEKRIPLGGGLGGGSSNAAAALRLANTLWNTGLSRQELAVLGARIGSDVPFFLYGGTCLCEGRGEIITPLSPFPEKTGLMLALSGIHSSTADAYRNLRMPGKNDTRRADAFIRAMEQADTALMAEAAFNRFEPTVFAALPALRQLQAALMKSLGQPVRMSGSGSALWWFGTAAGLPAGWRQASPPPARIITALS